MQKFKVGDTVKLITGKEKGETGQISKILKKQNKVIIDGLNMKIKHVKPKGNETVGEIIKISGPISISNIMICDKNGIAGRVGFKFTNNKKQRINKKTETIL